MILYQNRLILSRVSTLDAATMLRSQRDSTMSNHHPPMRHGCRLSKLQTTIRPSSAPGHHMPYKVKLLLSPCFPDFPSCFTQLQSVRCSRTSPLMDLHCRNILFLRSCWDAQEGARLSTAEGALNGLGLVGA